MSSQSNYDRQGGNKGNYSLVGIWLRRLGGTYFGAWLLDLFQTSTQAMASAAASGPAPAPSSGGGGPLSFMGCMREASPPPYDEQPHHHHRPLGLPTGEFGQLGHGFDSMPKEPKKRRFHPLRGLRRIFRKKSRGAADVRLGAGGSGSEREISGEHITMRDREEVTLRDPAGRAEEIRSRSASELLTDSCDRDRLFLRRRDILEESFANLQRNSGGVAQLSVSHDSVFPGEVPHTRPLSSLDMHASLERRTSKASSNDTDHKDTHTAQRHRISLRVLEQIKTVIENRNQIAAAASTTTTTTTTTTTSTTNTTETTNSLHNRFSSSRDKSERTAEDTQAKVPRKDAPTPTNTSTTELPGSPNKEDLPELTTGSLNHTAALHRISVRPKNRRPPRRSTSQSSNMNSSSNGLPRIDSISENSIDTLDSLEAMGPADNSISSSNAVDSPPTTPQEVTKPIPILRKSSSRLSRNSEVFEELEAKLPVLRKPAVSPDSLDSNLESRYVNDVLDISEDSVKAMPPRPSPRTASTGSEGYEKSSTALSSPRRRSSSNRLSKSPDSLEGNSPGWLTKSSEGFDKLLDFERENNLNQKPVAAARRLLLTPISKSQERVNCSKSSDSLEALEALNSDDSMERRRSSFEIRPRRNQVHKLMSKSTECFDSTLVEHQQLVINPEEKRKRASLSEMNLSRGSSGSSSRHSKLLSKSSESFEKISSLVESHLDKNGGIDLDKSNNCWRGNRRVTHSSESSDNLDLDDNCKLENRNKARRSTPKRLSSGSSNNFVDEQDNVVIRKPSSRLQKSSESSELGSTDTLDSERRNTMKSSDSDETLDSLEKDLHEQSQTEQDRKDEETMENVLERREKNCEDDDEKVGTYWRKRTNSQESKGSPNNMDIHQLLAYTLVSRIQENGNNDENNEENHDEDRTSKTICSTSPIVVYPKKKQHQQQMQQQSSSEDNKTLSSSINNLLPFKTDEDLQNMLNGNISEVSTDTRSFKEKLIMFEKLGK